MDTSDECKALGLDAKIFMLVHDSIVAIVRDEHVDQYKETVSKNTQRDMGVSIPGSPIGVDQDVGQDYSFGKFEDQYEIRGNCLASISA